MFEQTERQCRQESGAELDLLCEGTPDGHAEVGFLSVLEGSVRRDVVHRSWLGQVGPFFLTHLKAVEAQRS